jgi:hypothetical protein
LGCSDGGSDDTGDDLGQVGGSPTTGGGGSGGSTGGTGSGGTAASGGTATTGGTAATGGATATGGSATAGSGGVTASGGSGPATVLTLEEGDPALCGGLGAVSAANAGYVGDGFFDGVNRRGASLSWVVDASVAGSYELTIRYANGDAAARGAKLRVAHGEVGPLAFAPSGDWATWTTDGQSVSLQALALTWPRQKLPTGCTGRWWPEMASPRKIRSSTTSSRS